MLGVITETSNTETSLGLVKSIAVKAADGPSLFNHLPPGFHLAKSVDLLGIHQITGTSGLQIKLEQKLK